MRAAFAFVRLTRPVFLLGGGLAFWIGTRLGSSISLGRYLLGQAMVTAIQLTTQYANEYFDQAEDRTTRRTWFSGGSGVLVRGELSPKVARGAAAACTLLSGAAIAAVAGPEPVAALAGAAALAVAWFYSAPPLRLSGSGIGEPMASMVVAVLVPLVGARLAGAGTPIELVGVTGPLFLLHWAMLLSFSRPDTVADQAAGKRTQLVRLGLPITAALHGWLAGTAVVIMAAGGLGAQREAGLAALPLVLWQAVGFRRAPDQVLTVGAVGLFTLTAAVIGIGLSGS